MQRNCNQSFPFGRICGRTSVGVRGADIPLPGTSGPSYMYNLLSLPADDDVLFQGIVTSVPPGLSLQTDEDGSGTATAPDGTYIVPFDLYANNVLRESSSFSLTFGGAALTISASPGNAVADGVAAAVRMATTVLATPGNAVAAGIQAAISFANLISCTPGNAVAQGIQARIRGDGAGGQGAGGPFNIIIRRRRR